MYLPIALKRAILGKQQNKCAKCGRTITLDAHRLRDWKKILGRYPDRSVPSRARFHHKKWRAEKGSDTMTNIVALCGRCHAEAHRYYKKYKKKMS